MSAEDPNPAATPTPCEDLQGDGRWMSLHNRFVSDSKDKEPDVLFVGDSLIQLMHQFGIWRQLFSPLHALNFGVGGDATQHVLWRLSNGELDNISPKGVLPRGKLPNPLRDRNAKVNQLVQEAVSSLPHASFLNVDPGFVHSNGSISHQDMYDYLHLTPQGYQAVCEPLHAHLKSMLDKPAEN
ncbi:platelet-activating factor acetylhydrolase IB subunit gamma isoform X2 [Micropterus salmoides]|uniref:platelet-activating factor acetylhydrolase IB subunit gamma isoform X2 n=1 Tax=Micropterus salmoides TaxID=27706 RepID=UPI0018EE1D33|nr:platelet-activating factor acetylhydrolase IB subunit gamma isoform X2 [Micropterus salmoides]